MENYLNPMYWLYPSETTLPSETKSEEIVSDWDIVQKPPAAGRNIPVTIYTDLEPSMIILTQLELVQKIKSLKPTPPHTRAPFFTHPMIAEIQALFKTKECCSV